MAAKKIVVEYDTFENDDRETVWLRCGCDSDMCERGIWTYADNHEAVSKALRYMASDEDACEYGNEVEFS